MLKSSSVSLTLFASLLMSLTATQAATVNRTVVEFSAGGGYWGGAVGSGPGRNVDVISFSTQMSYIEYMREYQYEYDYFAFDGTDRNTSHEVFFLGNESTSSFSANVHYSGLYGSDYPVEFSRTDVFGMYPGFDWAFPFGGFVVTQENYTGSRLWVTSIDGGAFTATITTYAAIPEPTTWGFLIIGAGAIGGTLRRRRSNGNFRYA